MRFNLIIVFLFCYSFLNAQSESEIRLQKGYAFFNALHLGQGEAAFALLDSSVHDKTNSSQLNGLWRQIEQGMKLGKFQDTLAYSMEGNTLFLGLQFENNALDFKVSFTESNAINAFFFAPLSDKRPYILPSYVDTTSFIEQDFVLQSGKYRLAGKLCIPKTKGPHPLCILSHGSGPNGMDEKLGPNRIFKDMAYGLASKGVAVFRFNKRTAVYGAKSAEDPEKLTVNDEYLEDLNAAIDTFSDIPTIDTNRIYLLGHSLGGYLAPRVAANHGKLAGIILAAAPCNPLDSVLLRQISYLDSIDTTGTYYRPLKNIEEAVAYLRSDEFDLDSDPSWLPLGLNAYYWMDLLNYDPIAAMQSHPLPVLVLNGEADYQVSMDEFRCWKTKLAPLKQTRYQSFPGLGHGFFPSNGILGPAQYDQQYEVDAKVIIVILDFIR